MRKILPFAKTALLSATFLLFVLSGFSKNIKTFDDGKSQLQIISSSELHLKMINRTGQVKMDIIGMTNMAEARLAREAEICYVTLAAVTDYDCWHETAETVSVEMILEYLKKNVQMKVLKQRNTNVKRKEKGI